MIDVIVMQSVLLAVNYEYKR